MPAQPNEKKFSYGDYLSAFSASAPTFCGSVVKAGFYPIDTFCKKVQMQHGPSNYSIVLREMIDHSADKKGIRKFTSFFPGFYIATGYKVAQLSLLGCLEPGKVLVKKHIQDPMAADLVVGGVLGGVQTGVLQPLSIFKLRIQVGFAGYTLKDFKYDMSSGLGVTFARNFGFLGTTALLSTQLEKLALKHYAEPDKNGECTLSTKEKENVYIVSAATAGVVVTPLDLAKVRTQTWPKDQVKPAMTTMVKDIVKKESFRSLMKGTPVNFPMEVLGLSLFYGVKRKVAELQNEQSNSPKPK